MEVTTGTVATRDSLQFAHLCQIRFRPGCGWCGRTAELYVKKLYREKNQYMCAACSENPPARGAEVLSGYPRWYEQWLRKNHRREREYSALLDHCGHDKEKSFISEPYADLTPEFTARVAEFATLLGVRHSISLPSWHAPFYRDCVRLTFFNPPDGSGRRSRT
jgi:hypothetical protein